MVGLMSPDPSLWQPWKSAENSNLSLVKSVIRRMSDETLLWTYRGTGRSRRGARHISQGGAKHLDSRALHFTRTMHQGHIVPGDERSLGSKLA
jgi:hypothetical protein